MKRLLEIVNDPGFDKLFRSFVFLLCLLVLAVMGIVALVWDVKLDPISVITTAVIAIIFKISEFDWGTSAGSKTKDETIKNMLNQNTNTNGQQPNEN